MAGLKSDLSLGLPGFNCWISFALVFSCMYCVVLIFVLLCIYRLGIFHANHLRVLIQIRIKGNVGTVKHVQYFYWPFQAAASIVGLF